MSYDTDILRGRRAIFFMQMFSIMGFAILLSTLVLYTTQSLKLDSHYALSFGGEFIAFNFALHILGGYVGGRLLSYRALFTVGMILQAIGCFVIAFISFNSLILGCAIFLTGCGLNIICINCMLTQLFDSHDKRRESAFLWNYSGMNLGFFIGYTVSGVFQLHKNFHDLFLFASIGSLVAFFLARIHWKKLKDKGTTFSKSKDKKKRIYLASFIILSVLISLTFLLKHANLSNILIRLSGVGIFFLFVYFSWKENVKAVAKKLRAYLILAIANLIFWTLYEMAPMGLTLFFEHNVDRHLFGQIIPPQWMQNINTIIIVCGGPSMALINGALRKRGHKITIPFQFTTALFLIGLGFLLLPLGIYFADAKGYSSIGWIVGSYAVQSVGELLISPIGYAMVGQLISTKLQSLAMGTWIFVVGIGSSLSSYFSQKALGSLAITNPQNTNPTYSQTFIQLGFFAIATGFILFFLRPFLHKLIQEKEIRKETEPAPYKAQEES